MRRRLLQPVQNLPSLNPALWALGRFLRHVAGKVRDVHEMEVGAAERTVEVSLHHYVCGAKSVIPELFGFRLRGGRRR